MAVSTILSTKNPSDIGTNAPNFTISIQGGEVPIGVRQLIRSVEYESADGYADMLKIVAWDPDFVPPKSIPHVGSIGGLGGLGLGSSGASQRLVDTKIFQPGNEISVGFGYGSQIKHCGRAIIRKMRPTFPSDDIPLIEVVAYTKDVLMMENAPKGSKKKKGKGGRRYKDSTWADAVRDRAEDYGFDKDIDDTGETPHDFIQKVGLKDYEFVNGLANLTGFVFWVDGDSNGKWTLHFKNPSTTSEADAWPFIDEDPKKYTFKYNSLNESSLLAFEPEVAIQGSQTELKVQTKNPKNGRLIEVTFTESNDGSPEVTAEISGDTLRAVDQALSSEHTTGSDVKIFLNEFAFEERANRQFTSEAELTDWAKQWFRRQRENFVMARGVTIGSEFLRARQTHTITGIGSTLSGDYYFSRVRHILNEQGYLCDFNCRKVVPRLP